MLERMSDAVEAAGKGLSSAAKQLSMKGTLGKLGKKKTPRKK
jgi:hypothetical protein